MTEGEVHRAYELESGYVGCLVRTASEMCPYVDAFALPEREVDYSSLHCPP